MCTIKNYRFIISALGSAYINDYEKYTTEAFYLLNYLSEINFHQRRDERFEKMLLLINSCNKRGNFFTSNMSFRMSSDDTVTRVSGEGHKHNHTHKKKISRSYQSFHKILRI